MIQSFDRWFIKWISELHTPILDELMTFVTSLGNYGFIWLSVSVLLLLFKKWRIYGILALFSLAVCTLLGEYALKHLFERPRPFIAMPEITPLVHATNYSFPSNHTASAFAAAGIFARISKPAAAASYTLASLIMISRVYVLVHYPTDVLCGALLGSLCAFAVWTVYEKKILPRTGSTAHLTN